MAACRWSLSRLSWPSQRRLPSLALALGKGGSAGPAVRGYGAYAASGGPAFQSLQNTQKRHAGSYVVQGYVEDFKPITDFDVIKSPPEWKYVERLLPIKLVPIPTPKAEYPSGWIPPNPEAMNGPYFVGRTKNYAVPVYTQVTYRGTRKITVIRKISGDIWQMEKDLRAFLAEKLETKCPDTRVHELCCQILVRGEHVINVQRFLYSKGF